MIRTAAIRVRPRRKRRKAPPRQTLLEPTLAARQAALSAELHDHAAQTFATLVERLRQRAAQTASSDRELAPYLNAFVEAASTTFGRNVLSLLDEVDTQPVPVPQSSPPHENPKDTNSVWDSLSRWVVPVRARKEPSDVAAQPTSPAADRRGRQ